MGHKAAVTDRRTARLESPAQQYAHGRTQRRIRRSAPRASAMILCYPFKSTDARQLKPARSPLTPPSELSRTSLDPSQAHRLRPALVTSRDCSQRCPVGAHARAGPTRRPCPRIAFFVPVYSFEPLTYDTRQLVLRIPKLSAWRSPNSPKRTSQRRASSFRAY